MEYKIEHYVGASITLGTTLLDNRGATRLRLSNWPDTEAIRINVPITLEPGNPASLITASATKQQL
jgi:hypothetical protein